MNRTVKISLAVLFAIAVIAGIATSIMSYIVSDDISDRIFAPAKYYEQNVIGSDRANKEQMDKRFYISEEMFLSAYIEDNINSTINMQCQLSDTDDYNDLLSLVTKTLPSYYSQLEIKNVYAGTLISDLTPEKDIKMLIRFSNGALIYAYLPNSGEGYYAHEVCRLKTVKRNATAENLPTDIKVSGTSGMTTSEDSSIGIIEADYISDKPYVKALWINNSDIAIEYGSEYKIYRIDNEKALCEPVIDNLAWNSMLYIFNNGSTTRDFSLEYYDLSAPGTYCIEFNFNFQGQSTIHTASLEFEIAETPESYSAEQNTSELKTEQYTAAQSDEFTTVAINANSFKAKIIEVNDNNILVEPLKNENEYKSADRIYVSTSAISDLPVLNQNDEVTITYDGYIMESYPAQISKVYSIKAAE